MEKNYKTVICNLCGRRVKNDFGSKWKHFLTSHPGDAMERIGPMLHDHEKAKQFGEGFGRKLMVVMQEFRRQL